MAEIVDFVGIPTPGVTRGMAGLTFLATLSRYSDLNRRIRMNSEAIKTRVVGTILGSALLLGVTARAQSNPGNSAANPYMGSVQAVALSPEPKALSLDDAIKLGIQNNLALTLAREQQKTADATKLQLVTVLLPNITLHGETGVHQYNLEAEGFHPASLEDFASHLPAGAGASFPLVTKVDTTIGQVNVSQALFNWAGYDVWRASQAFTRAAYYNAQ
jgi:hypothetical protein